MSPTSSILGALTTGAASTMASPAPVTAGATAAAAASFTSGSGALRLLLPLSCFVLICLKGGSKRRGCVCVCGWRDEMTRWLYFAGGWSTERWAHAPQAGGRAALGGGDHLGCLIERRRRRRKAGASCCLRFGDWNVVRVCAKGSDLLIKSTAGVRARVPRNRLCFMICIAPISNHQSKRRTAPYGPPRPRPLDHQLRALKRSA
jgi:hypothetical protein